MGHLHSVYDTDNHFKVNSITREITDVSKSKTLVVQHDHNSERFTFEIPRYIEGHDMSECNEVSVHYQNGDPKVNCKRGKYKVGDFQISPANEDIVICSWLISKFATQYAGALKFQLWLECITEKDPDYVWKTAVYTGITVREAITDFDVIEDGDYIEYPDEPEDPGTDEPDNPTEPDEPVTKKLAAPVIYLEADDEEGEDDIGEKTPAIVGVAVLGRTILGDVDGEIKKLSAPVIYIDTVTDEGEELPKLSAPEIEIVAVATVLDAPEIEIVEV